jgi:hypothetical protein
MSASYLFRQTEPIVASKFLPPPLAQRYGAFSSSVTQLQTGGVANTPTPITYNTTELNNGVAIDGSVASKLVVSAGGVYKILYSIQLDKSGGGTPTCDIWIRQNGQNVPRSAGQVVVAGPNGETLPCVEYLLAMDAGDDVEVVFSSSDASMAVTAFPENVVVGIPAVPSIITNIVQIA